MNTFGKTLIQWYLNHKRDLPWRETKDPFKIWLSEIILQQTRVDQGLNYYLKFIQRFENVHELASAEQDEVLKLWQGLGYYSRARNLHSAAKQVVEEYNGNFPNSFKELKKLKGVGDYTAAAIASFSFKEPVATVDGNVYRVLARNFDIETPIDTTEGKRAFNTLANSLIEKESPDLFNQAMMEFGAIQCTPKKPNCTECIFKTSCLALEKNTIDIRPIKSKKVKQRNRYFHFFIFKAGNSTFIRQRTAKDIWQGLYEFPLAETKVSIPTEQIITEYQLIEEFTGTTSFEIKSVSTPIKHILSHQIIHTVFWHLDLKEKPNGKKIKAYKEVGTHEIDTFALPRLIDRYLENKKGI
ncbi:MAG: A/G-specific adenine glycosylase [Crocinitomicaceae bacterium]|nr:A/G-specific adenine glycosylase [Crocinitomicaceae bacterium]|tara:strand:- start:1873 stop:2937 length:1065 start_codon:yes stop_codon:yes gene_type:complete